MEIIGWIIAIIVGLAIFSVLLKLAGWIIGCAIVPALLTWWLFDSFWIGAIIGVGIGIWMQISKARDKSKCIHCGSHNTFEVEITEDLIDNMEWIGERRVQMREISSIWKCNECDRYTIITKH